MVFGEKHKNKILFGIQKKGKDDRESKSCHIYSLKKQALRTCVGRKEESHIFIARRRADLEIESRDDFLKLPKPT